MSTTNFPDGVRVRFAPSPTGRLHIGGARTAIYNWAFARAMDGTFILRIEDTDPTRSTQENTDIILRAMEWLGLTWDEGPGVGGPAAPYFQTERRASYEEALERLIAKDAVYPCFCTKEELEARKAQAEAETGGYSGYDRTCRSLDPKEVQARIAAGEPHVWRLKVPEDHGPVSFDDAVYGPTSFPIDVMDDLIVVRSDGTPTYNFAVVCDDAAMGITHVIRGDDHLSNTPRQILIYEALGAPLPTFAHLPMILGPDGKKLSKRHGAESVEEYRDRGYLPDALVNFLALLGWSLDGETTIIPPAELCHVFTLDRINRKDAVFDVQKLDWMNGAYLRDLSFEQWYELAKPWLARAVIAGWAAPMELTVEAEEPSEAQAETPLDGTDELEALAADEGTFEPALFYVEDSKELFSKIFPLIIERLVRLDEIPGKLAYFFWGFTPHLDEKSVQKVLLKEGARADEALRCCRAVLADKKVPWKADALQERCRAAGETIELKPRQLFQPLRVAICGNMVSPPLFESIELLMREEVLARIDEVLTRFW